MIYVQCTVCYFKHANHPRQLFQIHGYFQYEEVLALVDCLKVCFSIEALSLLVITNNVVLFFSQESKELTRKNGVKRTVIIHCCSS